MLIALNQYTSGILVLQKQQPRECLGKEDAVHNEISPRAELLMERKMICVGLLWEIAAKGLRSCRQAPYCNWQSMGRFQLAEA